MHPYTSEQSELNGGLVSGGQLPGEAGPGKGVKKKKKITQVAPDFSFASLFNLEDGQEDWEGEDGEEDPESAAGSPLFTDDQIDRLAEVETGWQETAKEGFKTINGIYEQDAGIVRGLLGMVTPSPMSEGDVFGGIFTSGGRSEVLNTAAYLYQGGQLTLGQLKELASDYGIKLTEIEEEANKKRPAGEQISAAARQAALPSPHIPVQGNGSRLRQQPPRRLEDWFLLI